MDSNRYCPIVFPDWSRIEWMPAAVSEDASSAGVPSRLFDLWSLVTPLKAGNMCILWAEPNSTLRIGVDLESGKIVDIDETETPLALGVCNTTLRKFTESSIAFADSFPFYTSDQWNSEAFDVGIDSIVQDLKDGLEEVDPEAFCNPDYLNYWHDLADSVEIGDWATEDVLNSDLLQGYFRK